MTKVISKPKFDLLTMPSSHSLTAEGLMLYLQSRLDGLDAQIDAVFQKQKNIEAVRKALMKIQTELDKLNDNKGDTKLQSTNGLPDKEEFEKNIQDAIKEIEAYDPALAKQIDEDFGKNGQILYGLDGKYLTGEVVTSREYINNIMKQLESSAQLEMIGLQSTMSARQTAIQLSTNLISALNKGTESIVANIGR